VPAAAGIAMRGRTPAPTALAFNLGHSRPHHDTSTEFHTEAGPFTLVPLPRRRSSLVFVVDPAEVANLSMLTDAEMAAEVERRSHSILGKIEVEPGRGVFPLMVETAARFGAGRVALMGKLRTSLHRSARKGSISVCATPPPSASSSSPPIGRDTMSGN